MKSRGVTLRAPGPDEGECLDLPFEVKALSHVEDSDGARAGVFEGLASTFGERDLLDDVIEPGAFRDVARNLRGIKMLWQHDATQPIGVWKDADVVAGDIDGDNITVAAGIIASLTDDRSAYSFGYVGSRRFVRVTLEPTGLTNGGPVGLVMLQGHGHLTPVAQG